LGGANNLNCIDFLFKFFGLPLTVSIKWILEVTAYFGYNYDPIGFEAVNKPFLIDNGFIRKERNESPKNMIVIESEFSSFIQLSDVV
jgi:hypothetical protein